MSQAPPAPLDFVPDWATGVCSAHQEPDPLCRICNPALAKAKEEIDRLRKLDGNDDHPENRCDRCGGRNLHNWYADSDVWNRVTADWSILCPICFSELAREVGVAPAAWRLSIEGDDPEVSKLRVQLHARLKEASISGARVAQLEHEAECYWYDLASGEFALAHCEECRRLDGIVKATVGQEAPPAPTDNP